MSLKPALLMYPTIDDYCLSLVNNPAPSNRYVCFFGSKPLLLNAERNLYRYERAKIMREWREAFYLLAKQQRIPKFRWVTFHVVPYALKRGRGQDPAAAAPAAKAAIDGIVDAGIIPDDSGVYVRSITFHPAVKGHLQGLALVVCGEK